MKSPFAFARTARTLGLFLSSILGAGVALVHEVRAETPVWDQAILNQTPETFPAEPFRSKYPEVRALFHAGLPYQGKPTRVFAWLGMPKLEPGQTAPGIVLIHGGYGTAYEDWVKLWVDRGYAAIAMDNCGTVPEPLYANPRPRHAHAGPPGWGGFEQTQRGEPLADHWTYHAVADAMLANSLLRVQPGVDSDRIGVTGISWGGYLTCIVAGVDPRFRFAVPVYGSGSFEETSFSGNLAGIGAEAAAQWLAAWDPVQYLPKVRIPMLWINGPNDFAFWPSGWQRSHSLIPADLRTLSLIPGMLHSQQDGAAPREIAAFADSIVKGGPPLPRVLAISREGDTVTVRYRSPRPLTRATLVFTEDPEHWVKRVWKTAPAVIHDDIVTATLPANALLFYVNLTDDRECTVSTAMANQQAGTSGH